MAAVVNRPAEDPAENPAEEPAENHSDQPVRRYRSAQRAQAAAQTKARIRTAAAALFVEHGYVATTMRDIARAADVGERTVYAAFPGKADLFRYALDVATVGDEQPVAVADRPEIQTAFAQSDPKAAVDQAVAYTVALFERAGDLIMVTIQAADADPDMRGAADAGAEHTQKLWLSLTQKLAGLNALRAGLTPRSAADIIYALASPQVHQLLRRHRGWSKQRYQAWLTDVVKQQILAG